MLENLEPYQELKHKSLLLIRQGQKHRNKTSGKIYLEGSPHCINSCLKTNFQQWKEAQGTKDLDLVKHRFGLEQAGIKYSSQLLLVSWDDFIQEIAFSSCENHNIRRSDAAILDVSYLKCNQISSHANFFPMSSSQKQVQTLFASMNHVIYLKNKAMSCKSSQSQQTLYKGGCLYGFELFTDI